MAASRDSHYRLYQDQAGEWRWSFIAANGKVVADSAEGYSTKSNAKRAANTMRSEAWAPIVADGAR